MAVDPYLLALATAPPLDHDELLLGDPAAAPLTDPRPDVDPLTVILAAEEQAMSRPEPAELSDVIRALPVLERLVIRWRYGIGREGALTVDAVAAELWTAKSTAWKLEQRGLALLRRSRLINLGGR